MDKRSDNQASPRARRIGVVLGAGVGSRAGGGCRKQFRLLRGRQVLLRSADALIAGGADELLIVVPRADVEHWRGETASLPVPAHVTAGGASRAESVAFALRHLKAAGTAPETLVAIHDGARPLVPSEVVRRGWERGADTGAAIPVVPLTDSIRVLTPDGSRAESRDRFRAVQTPQVFTYAILSHAYGRPCPGATDDASVVEAAGIRVDTFDGSPRNIKITHPTDFAIAEALLDTEP